MNGPGDIPDPVERNPCGISSILPLGMACRGRAEAFARRLQSRLRTLGTQEDNDALQHDHTEESENTWLTTPNEASVQNLQPLRNTEAADAFFDFDIEPESPGSPIDECEYTRLIESATNTPHEATSGSENPDDQTDDVDETDSHQQNQHETESGYVCASPCSSIQGSNDSQISSHNSSDIQYYDPESSESTSTTFYDCVDSRNKVDAKLYSKLHNVSLESPTATALEAVVELPGTSLSPSSPYIPNGHVYAIPLDSDSCSESLPPSQSTDSNHTYTALSSTSASNSTLQDENVPELQTEDKIEPDLNDNTITLNKNSPTTSPVKITTQENGEEKSTLSETLTKDEDIQVIVASPQEESAAEENEVPKKRQTNRLASITETDEEEEDEKPQRLRRCSSLKTGKTPPGTPGRKKFVRFADVFGLDLADVKTFLDHEVPKIPKSAYEDLDVKEHQLHQIQQIPQFMKPVDKILVPLFQQPGGLPSFLDKVREKQVSLENCAVTDPITLTITGSVRVRNLDFHKSVYIRYTLDNWKSFSDVQANYVENSCDGFSDKFSFTIFGNSLQIGQRIEVAVRFHCKGQQYWDNNYDSNYCFQCLPVNQQPKPQVRQIIPPLSHNECSGAFY
uniref:CSON010172 protein n=1 Tax=Culicoides sonorensis TaxID=179676 RepID=A0A336LKP5_CULSO